jgi:diguanylate cyclase (GGDEF)-like protein
MEEGLSKRTLARLAASLFVLAAVVAEVARPLPKAAGMDVRAIGAVSIVCMGIAALLWVLPWNRLPRAALVPVALVALGLKGLGNYTGNVGPYAYGLHYVLIFTWVGFGLPRWSSVALAPVLVASYLTPMWLKGLPGSAMASLAIAAPICVFLGEATAWLASRLRSAQRLSQERSQEMAVLVEATLALAGANDRDELSKLTVRAAANVLEGGCAAVVVQRGDGSLEVTAQTGWPEGLVAHPTALVEVAASSLSDDAEAAQRSAEDLARRLGVCWLDAMPLRGSAKEPCGVAVVGHPTREAPHDRFLEYVGQTLATQAGLGLERLRHTETLRDASLTDPLTGLGNRRRAATALEQLREGDALAMVDLDRFKEVNDRLGHAAGDRLLTVFAEFLRGAVRGADEAFRMGGEEFLVVLRAGGEASPAVMERIRAMWRQQKHVTTFSAGVAIHGAGDRARDTLARADAALYAAKDGGRDRVLPFGSGCEPPSDSARPH